MSLEAQVQAAVARAFDLAGDLIGDVYLTRKVQGDYDAATGDAPQADVPFKFRGVVALSKSNGGYSRNSAASLGSEVDTTTDKIFLEPRDDCVEPQIGDVARAGDDSYRVDKVNRIKPSGRTVFLWELLVTV